MDTDAEITTIRYWDDPESWHEREDIGVVDGGLTDQEAREQAQRDYERLEERG